MCSGNNPPPNPRRVATNLACLVVALALISGWMLHYTDWFPIFGGLFTLTGVFAWLAFVSKILTESRAKQLQTALDDKVLQANWMRKAVIGAMVILTLVLGFGRGTLVLDGLQDTGGRTVELRVIENGKPKAGPPLQRLVLSERGVAKATFWSMPFIGREIHVEVSGLPWQRVTVSSFSRTTVLVPRSFQERAVLLVRPLASKVAALAKSPERFQLVIEIGAQKLTVEPYGGESVLVGAQAGMELPKSLLDSWRLELNEAKAPSVALVRWMQPRILAPLMVLPPNAKVLVYIRVNNVPATSKAEHATVSPLGTASTFPLEIVPR